MVSKYLFLNRYLSCTTSIFIQAFLTNVRLGSQALFKKINREDFQTLFYKKAVPTSILFKANSKRTLQAFLSKQIPENAYYFLRNKQQRSIYVRQHSQTFLCKQVIERNCKFSYPHI